MSKRTSLSLVLCAVLPLLGAASVAHASEPFGWSGGAHASEPLIGVNVMIGEVTSAFILPSPWVDTGNGPELQLPGAQILQSMEQIEVLITTAPAPCYPNSTNHRAHDMCFDGIMPDGEIRRFHAENAYIGVSFIDGYTYTGPGVIHVEHAVAANYVSCMPAGAPDGCMFHYFRLIED